MTDTTNDPFSQTNAEQVNYLEVVTNKFKGADGNLDVAGLARGKYESDQFIETLKKELETERQKAAQGLSVKELLEEIKRTTTNSQEPPLATPPGNNPPNNAADIAQLVKDAISQNTNEQREAQNKVAVVNKLNETWGQNTGSELVKKANELGVSVKRLEEIGKESPQALFRMLGLDVARQVPGSTTVPTSRVLPNNVVSGDRTKSYYDKLYRDNPKLRHDSKTTAQEHRDALKLGAAFFDN